MYFPLAVITAFGVFELIRLIAKQTRVTRLFGYGILAICLIIPTSYVIQKNILSSNAGKEEQYRFFIEDLKNKQPSLKAFSLVDNNFGTSAYFYTHMYNKQEEYNIKFHRGNSYEEGELVMACLNKVMDPLFNQYETEVLEHFNMCKLIKIKAKKSQ